MDDPHNLQRFVDAQEPVYASVLAELRDGRKRTHWMWFIFPQIQGLGSSQTSRRFAIASRDEAHAFLRHPLLGPRLLQCTALVNGQQNRSAHEIFGSPDDMKFHSSMTLFDAVSPGDTPYRQALDRYFKCVPDDATMAKL